jgi:hypothetical protein
MIFPNLTDIEVLTEKNPSRSQSLWIGLYAGIISFPEVVCRAMAPRLIGLVKVYGVALWATVTAIFSTLFLVAFVTVGVIVNGFTGKMGVKKTPAPSVDRPGGS